MRRALFAVLVVALLLPAASEAAFPGANGKIAFVRSGDIWTMNPDGTGQVNLTNSAQAEFEPAWSPDGNRIAFAKVTGPLSTTNLFLMFADGTGVTPVTSSDGRNPSWSPEGDRLAYFRESGGPFLARIDLDGSDETLMYNGDDDDYAPAWSPDGTAIAFHDVDCRPGFNIYTLESDATFPPPTATPFNVTNCEGPVVDEETYAQYPNWSPDGQKILFAFRCLFYCPNDALQTIRPDGTDRATVAEPGGQNFKPAWSPDGSKMVYSAETGASEFRIRTINADGTNVVDLGLGDTPDWQPLNQAGPEADVLSSITDSPDPVPAGGILTYTAQAKNLVGPDPATGVTLTVDLPPSVFYVSATPSQGSCSQAAGTVTCNFGTLAVGASGTVTIQVEPQTPGTLTATANATATEIDPVPGNNASQATTTVSPGGYARPKTAAIIRAPLVPAFRACDAGQATLTHGPPLDQPSCGSPALTSGYLTVGAGSVGHVKLKAIGELPVNPNNGDQADVIYNLGLSDVRRASDLSDYTGELQVQTTLRLTDRHSSPSGRSPATLSDTAVSFDAPCTATPAAIGASCGVSTSADAVVPGIAQESRRAIWDLGKVRVLDGGADGDAQTGPNTLFAVQGVFVP